MQRLLFTLLLTASTLFGVSIEGYGYEENQVESKKLALDDLSNNISVYVKSDYSSFVDESDKEFSKKIVSLINIKSELPIIGASFSYNEAQAVATLSAKNALHLYEQKLLDYKKELDGLKSKIDASKNSEQMYALYELALSLTLSYEKHEVVALILGHKREKPLEFTQTHIKAKMIELSQNITSIELASKILASKFTNEDIFVYAPSVNGSNEVTSFARVLRDAISSKVKQASSPASSKYKLVGNYETSKKGAFVTYNLLDTQNNTLASSSVFIQKSAYDGLEIEPKNISFDEEVELSSAKLKSDLRVDLSIKEFGSKNVLLRDGDEVELVVKSNRQAYFYLVGHILHEDEKFSYLVELQDGVGDERFVYTIGASDVNKPFLLPLSFSVSEPFGYESLQMFASTEIPSEMPKCKMHDGYCVIGGKPEQVVQKTRGLKAKKKSVLKAEATLNFTTMQR
ncbi:MAG: hypothetical protein RBR59_03390 [Sulfurimonadaceae bacterium]|jgi:hypothetical protein|nr:hypothetical protein [Sulfurimonadaceae bacterium]